MMKKLLAIGSVLSVLVLTGAGCKGGVTAPQPQVKAPVETNSSARPESQLPVSQEIKTEVSVPNQAKPKVIVKEIAIANFAFSPANITVKAGTAITWVNDDEAAHSIKSSDGSFPGSENLNTGSSYQFKFDKPGTYNYSCGLHPSMHGTVVVE